MWMLIEESLKTRLWNFIIQMNIQASSQQVWPSWPDPSISLMLSLVFPHTFCSWKFYFFMCIEKVAPSILRKLGEFSLTWLTDYLFLYSWAVALWELNVYFSLNIKKIKKQRKVFFPSRYRRIHIAKIKDNGLSYWQPGVPPVLNYHFPTYAFRGPAVRSI